MESADGRLCGVALRRSAHEWPKTLGSAVVGSVQHPGTVSNQEELAHHEGTRQERGCSFASRSSLEEERMTERRPKKDGWCRATDDQKSRRGVADETWFTVGGVKGSQSWVYYERCEGQSNLRVAPSISTHLIYEYIVGTQLHDIELQATPHMRPASRRVSLFC